MRKRVSEALQRGPLVRVLVPGLLLGLSLFALVPFRTEGRQRELDAPVEELPRCKRYEAKVEVAFTPDGLVFSPSRCLQRWGTVRFVNKCSKETLTRVIGPVPEPVPPLPPGAEDDLSFRAKGAYVITVTGCSDIAHDSKTGTLEVGTGGDPDEVGATVKEETGAPTSP